MIYITGDTHGKHDIRKLNFKNFPESRSLCKDDYVIITGDFGFVWDGSNEDKYWLKWFMDRPFTTLFVDGNHENFNLLNEYPIEQWNGGKIHRINSSVIHLMRGEIFNISGYNIFTFGGAKSSDIEYRKEGKSWWREELPSEEEYTNGLNNLEKCKFQVDYIISHTCSIKIQQHLRSNYYKDREMTQINSYFELLENTVKFKHWYFGHNHLDESLDEKHTIVYNKIIKL